MRSPPRCRLRRQGHQPYREVDHFIKDVGIALAEAGRTKLALPGLALAEQLCVATSAQGRGERVRVRCSWRWRSCREGRGADQRHQEAHANPSTKRRTGHRGPRAPTVWHDRPVRMPRRLSLRRALVISSVVSVPLLFVVALATPASASTGVYFYPIEELHAAGDQLTGVACPAGGACVAVGSATRDKNPTPLIALQGRVYKSTYNVQVDWLADEPALPSGGAAGADDSLASVSCDSPHECFAVGAYDQGAGDLPLEYSGPSRGPWHLSGQSISIPPAHQVAPVEADLAAVSCNGAGTCLAVGNYQDSNARGQGMAVFLLGGTAQAFTVPPPPGAAAGAGVTLTGVSCIRSGCLVVGDYGTGSDNQRGMAAIVNIKSVTGCTGAACLQRPWHIPAPATSAGISTTLTGASCLPGGTCVISGYDINGSSFVKLPITSYMAPAPHTAIGFSFHTVYQQLPPHNQNTGVLNSIWCTATNDCAGVGTYEDATGHNFALLADLVPVHGWLDAGYTSGEGVAVGSQLDLTSIACWAMDDCATVGYATAPNGTTYPIDAVTAAPAG